MTIRNGIVTEFDYGVALNPGTLGNLLTALTVRENEVAGVQLSNADNNNRVIGNVVEHQSQRGIAVLNDSNSNTIRGNIARDNSGWGIYAVAGTTDGGGNRASGNGEVAQCFGVVCTA